MPRYYTIHDVVGAPQHPVYHKAAVDQTRAYPTAASIGTTARMIWEDRGLLMWRMKRGGEGSYRCYSSRCNIKICKKVDVTTMTKWGRGRVRYWWISIYEVLACCLGMCWVHRGPLAAMIVASSSRNWPGRAGTFTCAQKEARPKIFALVCMVNAPQSLGLHPHTIYQITRKNKGCPLM